MREAAVATARANLARASRSFMLASRLLERPVRERTWLLHAWCRRCRDIADGRDKALPGHATVDPMVRLGQIRLWSAAALAGEITGEAAFDGLGVLMRETGMPPRLVDEHIEGFALEAIGWRARTQDDLLRHCRHMAGAPGSMMAVAMGLPPDDSAALNRMGDLGVAFRLSGIARNLGADGMAGRCYLPLDWLAEMGIPPDRMMEEQFRPALSVLAARLAALADRFQESARPVLAKLPFRSRWSMLTIAGIHSDIARTVVRRGARAWDRRVTPGPLRMLFWVMRAFGGALSSGAVR